MFRKDNFIYGLIGGLCLPALAWCYETCMATAVNHKNTIFLISIGLNLLLVRMGYKKELTHMANGMLFVSFLVAVAMFYFKQHS